MKSALRRTSGLVLVLALLVAGAVGCGTGDDTEGAEEQNASSAAEFPMGLVRVEVLPEFVEVQAGEAGIQPHAQLRVVETGYELTVWPTEIEGITLEEGTSYVLDIQIEERDEIVADASSYVFRLVEVIEPAETEG